MSASGSGLLGANLCHTINRNMSGGPKHSDLATVELPNLKVLIIPALSDNYMYLVIDNTSQEAFVVDPVEPEAVLEIVKQENVFLTSALITHHHWDHAGGNNKLLSLHKTAYPQSRGLVIYGGDDRIDGLNKKVGHEDTITVGNMKIQCLFTPCHTTGHICYYVGVNADSISGQLPMVFTGDTLFIAGCGRFFEGTASQMHAALIQILGVLSANTLVFCGHEYTVKNLEFVLAVDPSNHEARLKLEWAQRVRAVKKPTVPSTIGEEHRHNIFMQSALKPVQQMVGASDAVECMDKLRTAKNEF